MAQETRRIAANLTLDQYNLARRKLFVEDLGWQQLIPALVNAYIMGDVSVTAQGRYMLSPPSGHIPVVHVPEGADVVEIEPEWGTPRGRPQVGATDGRQRPRQRERWGTRELAQHLRETTDRRISLQNLRKLLRAIKIPKDSDNNRWYFDGPEDENVLKVKESIAGGVYDALIREGIRQAEAQQTLVLEAVEEYWEAKDTDAQQRRIEHLKKLRSIEEVKE